MGISLGGRWNLANLQVVFSKIDKRFFPGISKKENKNQNELAENTDLKNLDKNESDSRLFSRADAALLGQFSLPIWRAEVNSFILLCHKDYNNLCY